MAHCLIILHCIHEASFIPILKMRFVCLLKPVLSTNSPPCHKSHWAEFCSLLSLYRWIDFLLSSVTSCIIPSTFPANTNKSTLLQEQMSYACSFNNFKGYSCNMIDCHTEAYILHAQKVVDCYDFNTASHYKWLSNICCTGFCRTFQKFSVWSFRVLQGILYGTNFV